MLLAKKRDKKSKKKISKVIRMFSLLAMIIYITIIITVSFKLLTERKHFEKYCYDSIKNTTASEDFFAEYKNFGIDTDSARLIVEGSDTKKLVASVMADRYYAIFRYSDTYLISEEKALERLREITEDITKQNSYDLTKDKLDNITTYSFEVTGLKKMFLYDNPLAYRENLANSGSEQSEYYIYNNVFKFFGIITKNSVFINEVVMFLIIFIIMLYISGKTDKVLMINTLADTILIPSFIFLGICIGWIMTHKGELNTLVSGLFKQCATVCLISALMSFIIIRLLSYIFIKNHGGNI